MEMFLPDVWATVLTWQSPRLPCDFYESRMTKEIRNQNHQSPSRDESLSKLVEMSNGARASARFTVGRERTLEMPGLFSLRTQKRRARRAPARPFPTPMIGGKPSSRSRRPQPFAAAP